MKVAKNVVVSIAYQVRTEDGVLVDEDEDDGESSTGDDHCCDPA